MKKEKSWLVKNYKIILIALAIIAVVILAELLMGRSFFGPDGKFGFWDGNVLSSENSQRLTDPYTFTHVIHGILIFALVWLFARKLPLKYQFLIALAIEGVWEILENSPIIINLYREMTISFGYVGDSVLNSVGDMIAMSFGFWFANKFSKWWSIATIVVIEVLLLIFVRDNLTLNIIMFIHPSSAIKAWQLAGLG